MKLPALQFYGGDWHKDPGIKALGYFDRGVWFEMLLMMHESEERGVLLLNGLPMPDEALAQALGLDNQILTTTLTRLLTYGVARRRGSDGAIYSRRMVNDENLRKVRQEAGKLGGNPLLVKQNTTTEDKQKSTPSSSYSSSIYTDSKKRKKPLTDLPKDFKLSENMLLVLEAANYSEFQIDSMLAGFIDYAKSKGKQYADWEAAFRNWVKSPYQTIKPNSNVRRLAL